MKVAGAVANVSSLQKCVMSMEDSAIECEEEKKEYFDSPEELDRKVKILA